MLIDQLSNQEQRLLFYHGLTAYGAGEYKALIEKYQMLRSVPLKDGTRFSEAARRYKVSAFGKKYPDD